MNTRTKTWKKMTPEQIDSVDWVLRVDCSPAVRGQARDVIHILHAELRKELARRTKQKAVRK